MTPTEMIAGLREKAGVRLMHLENLEPDSRTYAFIKDEAALLTAAADYIEQKERKP